jgi:Zn-dependent protease
MERGAAEARQLERSGDVQGAHARWISILPLLPHESKQAEWIRGHLQELQTSIARDYRPPQAQTRSKWARWAAPLAPLALILAKVKTFLFAIVKLKFLLSFAAFIGIYWGMWGPRFGIGFAVLILIHEMGHFVEIKRRGLPADMPVFLPGLGAYVRWQAMGVSLETRSLIALAGPCAGLLAAVVCAVVWKATGNPFWWGLARTSAWFNALNLIPVFILDGGRAILSLNAMQRAMLLAVSVGLFYTSSDWVFLGVAAGTGWQLLQALMAARQPSREFALNPADGGTFQRSSAQANEGVGEGNLLIATYFIALLTALGLLLYLLPGHGDALP